MNSRKLAFDTLKKIIIHGQYANLSLKSSLSTVDEQAKGFISQVVYGTLRNRMLLTYQWQDLVTSTVDESCAILLEMSVYQLFLMHKDNDYAVVNEAVNLAPRHQKKFVNGILRNVLRRGFKTVEASSDLEKLSIMTSHPLWIVQLWNAHYGYEKTVEICNSNCEDGVVFGCINTLKITKEQLMSDTRVEMLDDIGFKASFNLAQSDYFKEGKIWIQDYSGQQIAKLLDVKEGDIVLDSCSAPGSKTAQLAMMMNNKGKIIACDIHSHRLALVEEMMKRCSISIVECLQHDATTPFDEDMLFDCILADVPCSGLGVLRGKPEIKYRLRDVDIDDLVHKQQLILNNVVKHLKVNGTLVYSTCTLNKKENERQIEQLIKKHPEMKLLVMETLFPSVLGEGFFMAKLQKTIS